MIYAEHAEKTPSTKISKKNGNQDLEYGTNDKKVKMLPSQHIFSTFKNSSEQNGSAVTTTDMNAEVKSDSDRHEHFIRTQMTHLAGAFSARAQLFLSKLQRPPTPTQSSTSSFNSSNGVVVQASRTKTKKGKSLKSKRHKERCKDLSCAKVLDPQSRAYLWWLVVVSLCFAYNCWAIPLRTSFPKHTLTLWDNSLPSESAKEMPSPHTPASNSNQNLPQIKTANSGVKTTRRIRVAPSKTAAQVEREERPLLDYFTLDSPSYSKYKVWTYTSGHYSFSAIDARIIENESDTSSSQSTTESDEPTPEEFPTPSFSTISDNTTNFDESPPNLHTPTWLTLDVLADIVYLLDVILIQPRVSFLTESGMWANEVSTTLHSYSRRKRSKLDIIALLPLDIIFFFISHGRDYAYLRIPRLLKAGTFWEMCERLDVTLASPHAVRIARTLASMLYLVHLHACAYYLFSTWEGIASNGWVFSGRGNAYIRCFYFATKTATSIGKNPKPVNEAEYLFMTWSWLSGVFLFALLIGQIRDIVATASKSRSEFQRLLDETIHYMRRIHLPADTQRRVTQWLTHTWDHQQVIDEQEVLEWLPSKLRGDVALDVHEGSLSKVHLFRHCGQQLLRQLVLKLRPVLYLPGDFICRKGEVGTEMYIIKAGIVEVVGKSKSGPDGEEEVLATLSEGSVFGEISLLDIGGGNRRTADVRSKGFSTLFVLSKTDLKEALEHHPEAKQILKEKASQLIRENADRELKLESEVHREEDAVIIKGDPNKQPLPRLIETVIQAVGTKSKTAQLLMFGSKAMNADEKNSKIDNPGTRTNEEEIIKDVKSKSDLNLEVGQGKSGERRRDQEKDVEEMTDPFESSTLKDNSPNAEKHLKSGDSKGHTLRTSKDKQKYRAKKFGSPNIFECDVTVHQRMG